VERGPRPHSVRTCGAAADTPAAPVIAAPVAAAAVAAEEGMTTCMSVMGARLGVSSSLARFVRGRGVKVGHTTSSSAPPSGRCVREAADGVRHARTLALLVADLQQKRSAVRGRGAVMWLLSRYLPARPRPRTCVNWYRKWLPKSDAAKSSPVRVMQSAAAGGTESKYCSSTSTDDEAALGSGARDERRLVQVAELGLQQEEEGARGLVLVGRCSRKACVCVCSLHRVRSAPPRPLRARAWT